MSLDARKAPGSRVRTFPNYRSCAICIAAIQTRTRSKRGSAQTRLPNPGRYRQVDLAAFVESIRKFIVGPATKRLLEHSLSSSHTKRLKSHIISLPDLFQHGSSTRGNPNPILKSRATRHIEISNKFIRISATLALHARCEMVHLAGSVILKLDPFLRRNISAHLRSSSTEGSPRRAHTFITLQQCPDLPLCIPMKVGSDIHIPMEGDVGQMRVHSYFSSSRR